MPLISPAWRPPSMKKAGRSVGLPFFLLAIVICQISRPSNDWPTEYRSMMSGHFAAQPRSRATVSS